MEGLTEVEVVKNIQKKGYFSAIYSLFCLVFCIISTFSVFPPENSVFFVSKVPDTSNTAEKTEEINKTSEKPEENSIFTIKDPASVKDPSIDAEAGVKKYGEKFLYGHSSLAFDGLKTLYENDELILEEGGKTERYVVSKRIVEKKSVLDSNSALRKSIYSAAYRGKTYDLSLMTCGDGTNDDRNMRLIIFATKKQDN